jgi:hypothetical protein
MLGLMEVEILNGRTFWERQQKQKQQHQVSEWWQQLHKQQEETRKQQIRESGKETTPTH